MKSFLKKIIVFVLWNQVCRLRRKNNFKIIGVVGSMGKTSTKIAISKALSSQKKVMFQEGNYNDIVSVPLVFFGQDMPKLTNIFDWFKILLTNELKILRKYEYDFVVIEIGTDAPGQIEKFRKYLKLDLAVITAIAEEHMEFFKDINEVAEEEWSVSFWSDLVLVNKDLCKIIPQNVNNQKIVFYGKDFGSYYKIINILRTEKGFVFDISYKDKEIKEINITSVSELSIYSTTSALVVALILGLDVEKVKEEIKKIKPFKGRMQLLKGINNSLIIDDSYNASPKSMKIALDTIYDLPNKQKIAILGMMNELGKLSENFHRDIGKYCDPGMLDYVVTIGIDANKYIASEAEAKGCRVYRSKDSVDAGNFVKDVIKENSLILVKGSQNGVFAEESIKPLLKNKNDISLLVRQDSHWMIKKNSLFKP